MGDDPTADLMISYDPKNWIRILFDFPRSPVFRTLALDVAGAGVYAALVVWGEEKLGVAVPLGPSFLSILGIILGLLLVFRTNTAYDRWWEGRRAWGQLVNTSRAIAHALDAMLPDRAPERERYASLLAEYPRVVARHLRAPKGNAGLHEPNEAVRSLVRAVHADIRSGQIPREALVPLTPVLTAFDDVCGICERIRNTPIPFSYSSYVKQFVVLYALVMPFGLAREFGYGTIIASMFTFFATMGLELLATEIEEPFGTDRNDLPLEDITQRIGLDARQLLLDGPVRA